MPTNTIPALRLNDREMSDLCYSVAARAASFQKVDPKTSKRLWKLYDRLVLFGEAVAATKGK